jgi:hypothetical protein
MYRKILPLFALAAPTALLASSAGRIADQPPLCIQVYDVTYHRQVA